MSIRLRLTLLYSAILALTLIAFSIVLYVTLSRVLYNGVEQTLIGEAQRISANAKYDPRTHKIVIPASKVTAPDTLVQLRTAEGSMVDPETDKSPNLRMLGFDLPLDAEGLAAVQNGERWEQTIVVDGERLRVNSDLYRTASGTELILQVARPLTEPDRTLQQLSRLLIIGTGVATLIAFGVGWALAGAALKPIDRITHTAHDIGEERDFGRRVQYNGPADEIGRLATTFNAMLSALQGAFKQEAQALQAQRRFVADASHELRTPLTTIRGNIGLLQRTPPISAEDREAVLSDMAEESDRMSRLVNDLLVLARADAGRELHSEPVAIKPLIEDACRNARLLAPERTIHCLNELDVFVQGDHDALKQVLLILLDNALKFTPPSGRLTLTTALHENKVAITVQDTGIGISAQALPHIFERFYRGDTSRTGAGAGLGLAIAKTLVEGQHGSISVQSEPGQGSAFTIRLPRATIGTPLTIPERKQSVPVS